MPVKKVVNFANSIEFWMNSVVDQLKKHIFQFLCRTSGINVFQPVFKKYFSTFELGQVIEFKNTCLENYEKSSRNSINLLLCAKLC